jgi:hypothetical protein
MRTLPWMSLALCLAGCNLSPERFAEKVSYAWCDWRHGCDQIDAGQAEMCWAAERLAWEERLDSEACDFAQDRSRRLYGNYLEDLEATDCSLSEAYAVLSSLANDICQQPHSSRDTQDDPEDTGDSRP